MENLKPTSGVRWLNRIKHRGRILQHLTRLDSLDDQKISEDGRKIIKKIIDKNMTLKTPGKKELAEELNLDYYKLSSYLERFEKKRLVFCFTAQEMLLRTFGQLSYNKLTLDPRVKITTNLTDYIFPGRDHQTSYPRHTNYPRFYIALFEEKGVPVFYEMFEPFLSRYVAGVKVPIKPEI